MRGFILTTLLAGIMFAATAIQPVSNGKIEQIPASEFENVKKTFKTLKKVTDSKGRAIVADIPLDPTTDEVFQYALGGNKTMLIVVNKGQRSFLGDTIIRPATLELGKTLCAYLGSHDPDTTVPGGPQDPRVAINSAGGWFYFTKYPAGELVIMERSSDPKNNPSFYFTLAGGKPTVRRVRTPNLTTQSVSAPKAIPLNEWVYIQGRQQGLEHSVGWKTANDESTATTTFANSEAPVNVFGGSFFDMGFVKLPLGSIKVPPCTLYEENSGVGCRTSCIGNASNYMPPRQQGFRVKEFFWNSKSPLFALMNNYNAAEKELFQPTNAFGLDIDLINALIDSYDERGTNNTVLIFEDIGIRDANIDLYLNNLSSPTVYGFDLRRLPTVDY